VSDDMRGNLSRITHMEAQYGMAWLRVPAGWTTLQLVMQRPRIWRISSRPLATLVQRVPQLDWAWRGNTDDIRRRSTQTCHASALLIGKQQDVFQRLRHQ